MMLLPNFIIRQYKDEPVVRILPIFFVSTKKCAPFSETVCIIKQLWAH